MAIIRLREIVYSANLVSNVSRSCLKTLYLTICSSGSSSQSNSKMIEIVPDVIMPYFWPR